MNKKLAVVLSIVLVVGATGGAAAAISVITLDPEKLSLFEQSITDSDLTVEGADMSFPGDDEMTYNVSATNTLGSNQGYDVTVQAVDGSGNVLDSGTASATWTGGETKTLTFTLTATDIKTTLEKTDIEVTQQ